MVALYKWPGEIAEGNGERQIIIDERADHAQRVAHKTTISDAACEPLSNLFAVFATTCSDFCETLFLPRTAKVTISGVWTSSATPKIWMTWSEKDQGSRHGLGSIAS